VQGRGGATVGKGKKGRKGKEGATEERKKTVRGEKGRTRKGAGRGYSPYQS